MSLRKLRHYPFLRNSAGSAGELLLLFQLHHLAVKHAYLQHSKHRIVKEEVQDEGGFVFLRKKKKDNEQQNIEHKLEDRAGEIFLDKSLRVALGRTQQKEMDSRYGKRKDGEQNKAVFEMEIFRRLPVPDYLKHCAAKGNEENNQQKPGGG
jgi:hypothetical protein